MSQSAAPPVIAMRGAGYYSENTVGAKAVIDAAGDLVMQAIAGMDLAASGPVLGRRLSAAPTAAPRST